MIEVRLDVPDRLTQWIDRIANVLHRVELAGVVNCLLDITQLRFSQRLVKLTPEFRRHSAKFFCRPSKSAQHLRQVLGTDHNDQHYCDDQKFRPTDIQHSGFSVAATGAMGPTSLAHRDEFTLPR